MVPYLSWCLIVRNCEKANPGLLEQCLKRLKEITPEAELVIVDTMSSDNTAEIARKYADVFEEYQGPNGTWTREMAAFDNAAAARQRSFDLASGTWRSWVDADDLICTIPEAEAFLRQNKRWQPGGEKRAEIIKEESQDKNFIYAALKRVDADHPEVVCLWCPYAYQVDKDGSVKVWQDRERFMRKDSGYVWRSAAHEVCVPGVPDHRRPIYFAHCLFLHKKEFSPEAEAYSIQRHAAIMLTNYDLGKDRTTRTSLYLANFSQFLCPQRTWEFLEAAYSNATIPLDRYRALIDIAEEEARRGQIREAYEHLAAARATRADLPDAYLAEAGIAASVDAWGRAAEAYEKVIKCEIGHFDSKIAPREQVFAAPLRRAMCLWHISRGLNTAGDFKAALSLLDQAATIAAALLEDPALMKDKAEVGAHASFFYNEGLALRHLLALEQIHTYLVANDETQKAMQVAKVIPHQLRDHPLAVRLEQGGKLVQKHCVDPQAYHDFYVDDCATGAISTIAEHLLLPPEALLPRIGWLIRQAQQIAKGRASITVLDLGVFDGGMSTIPLIRGLAEVCKKVRYIAIETDDRRLETFKQRITGEMRPPQKDFILDLECYCGDHSTLATFVGQADIAVAYEVIEHVPDPSQFVGQLLCTLISGGKLFLSTPWSSFDKGNPYDLAHRDPRGHLRAMMPRDLVEAVENAGGRVLELITAPGSFGPIGAELFCLATPNHAFYPASARPKPVTFLVPSALWDWNASHLLATGMGASEEMIAFLARDLAKDSRSEIEVFGPLPWSGVVQKEEVNASVKYWPLSSFLRAKGQKLVVSRQPMVGLQLGSLLPQADKILWLQDAVYPDLSPKIAEAYARIVVVSEWHKRAMHDRHGVPLEKMIVAYNFLLPEHFHVEDPPKREAHRFFYGSSPDRGLLTLLKMWPRILDHWPDAQLDIFYGWEGCKKLAVVNPVWAANMSSLAQIWSDLRWQKGITFRGRINHEAVAREMLRADVWFYPTSFEETGCLTAVKARAAGCVPVTHPIAALEETARCDQAVMIPRQEENEIFEAYTSRCLLALDEAFSRSEVERKKMSDQAIEHFKISSILPIWQELLR